jgi:DNA-binding MarR family transcriptional regulator
MPDPADRRAKILTVTKRGARDLAAAQGVRDQVREVIFGVLKDGERDRLLEMLQRISAATLAIDSEEPHYLPG